MGPSKKSYERRAYESVDDMSLSKDISLKSLEYKTRGTNGLKFAAFIIVHETLMQAEFYHIQYYSFHAFNIK